ncbi:hypothetical protein AV274_3613 [Blastocystis sp. ATCC 50177/Nand II]|uniref:Transmembrane protein n=1 Tax=Blastocystis sp. subtype 1 (strain ATCC 50177 / NandII) TaxID=478820 RepID=A0A196SEY2_BLAHN|nr:hypothetical protein AV274_3613 [Blastocystis sp. ATCC 50177/Nand II]
MSGPMLSTTLEAATGKVVAVSSQLYQPPSHPEFDFLTAEDVADLDVEGLQGYNAYDAEDWDHFVKTMRWAKALSFILLGIGIVCSYCSLHIDISYSSSLFTCFLCSICSLVLLYLFLVSYKDLLVLIALIIAWANLGVFLCALAFAIVSLFLYANTFSFGLLAASAVGSLIAVALAVNVAAVHQAFPLFDDNDLSRIAKEERCCGMCK